MLDARCGRSAHITVAVVQAAAEQLLAARGRMRFTCGRNSSGRRDDMAGSVNKVILVGNLGRDPEVRHTQNNQKVVNLRIATSERWRDRQSGENRERTEWHSVVIFNENLADIAERYLRKASP